MTVTAGNTLDLNTDATLRLRTAATSLTEPDATIGTSHPGILLYPFITKVSVSDEAPPGTVTKFLGSFDTTGTHYIYVASVKSRESTGKAYTTGQPSPGMPRDPIVFEYREYAIEVTE